MRVAHLRADVTEDCRCMLNPALPHQKTLQDTGPCLTRFSGLRYLTFMAAGSASVEDEGQIAQIWSKACPTLRTIILPKGKVWFERDGKWTCCG